MPPQQYVYQNRYLPYQCLIEVKHGLPQSAVCRVQLDSLARFVEYEGDVLEYSQNLLLILYPLLKQLSTRQHIGYRRKDGEATVAAIL